MAKQLHSGAAQVSAVGCKTVKAQHAWTAGVGAVCLSTATYTAVLGCTLTALWRAVHVRELQELVAGAADAHHLPSAHRQVHVERPDRPANCTTSQTTCKGQKRRCSTSEDALHKADARLSTATVEQQKQPTYNTN